MVDRLIKWFRCSERMPAKNLRVIVKSSTDKAFLSVGHELHNHKNDLCREYGTDDNFNSYEYEWIPYAEDVWKRLKNDTTK